jgi:osmotically inducible protein OsmC
MSVRTAKASWNGTLKDGNGRVQIGPSEMPFSFKSRFEDGQGTNPEELIAAAHSGCYSMALGHMLAEAGHPAKKIDTTARVHLEKSGEGFSVPRIDLQTVAEVPDIDATTFQEHAQKAKENCVISKLVSAAAINLDAKLAT